MNEPVKNESKVEDKPDKEDKVMEHKVTLTYKCKNQRKKENKKDDKPDTEVSLSLPMKTAKMTEYLISESENFDAGASEAIKDWLAVFNEAKDKYVGGNSFARSLDREDGDWQQRVLLGEEEIKTVAAASKAKGDGGNISGDSALLMLNKALDLGTIIKVPLWHSGLWITIKAPTTATQIAVDRLLSNEKIILGRQTNGMVFSNVSVYLRKTLIDLALNCVISSSVTGYNKEMLLELIKITDYNTLLWALVCTIYPNGYRLVQPCVANIDNCNFVTEELIMLSKISWTDNAILSKEQKQFLAEQKKTKKSKKEILDYQNNGDWSKDRLISLNDSLALTITVPNLKQDLEAGIRWVDVIVDRVDEMFAESKMDDETRNMRILEQSKAGALRQYVSWIKSIHIGSEDSESSVVEDRFTIDLACESLTSDSKICKKIFEEIGKYIDDVTISLIGIPSYNCPNCQSPQTDEDSAHPEIIPLSIDDIFFTLIRQWTTRIIAQEVTF